MRKIILIAGSMLVLFISVIIIFRKNYIGSPDYNYLTAKLDIKNGNVRIINIGYRIPSSKDKEIVFVAAKYGFKNIHIGYDTTKDKMNGIKNYNEIAEVYLTLRNGNNWRTNYQKEVDSLYKVAVTQNNPKK